MRQPPLLLLYEPLSTLDLDTCKGLVDWLNQQQKINHFSLLVISHAPNEWQALDPEHWHLNNGKLKVIETINNPIYFNA